jgi:hypothetical protein
VLRRDGRIRPSRRDRSATSHRPDDSCASKLSSEGASSLFEALHVGQAALTHVPPAVLRAVPALRHAVPALGVIHRPRALVWIHALRVLVSIPLAVQAQASLLLLAYSPCAERERREREAQQLALIRE